jgi:hypothetical protein
MSDYDDTNHPMDSIRPSNPFFDDIFETDKEREEHEQELKAMNMRHFRGTMGLAMNKYAKFDRFEKLVKENNRITNDLLRKYDLTVSDMVSIAYSIVAEFIFNNPEEGFIQYATDEDQDGMSIHNIAKVYGNKYGKYIEETVILAFTKFRGGKVNRSIEELQKFFNGFKSERDVTRLCIRNFYASNSGSSDYVKMVHILICAYKFDNRDNHNLNEPAKFDYDSRIAHFSSFSEFFLLASWVIMFKEYEYLNAMIVKGFYNFKELDTIASVVETDIEDATSLKGPFNT